MSWWNCPKGIASPKVPAINDSCVFLMFIQLVCLMRSQTWESRTWNSGGPWRRDCEAFLSAVPRSDISDIVMWHVYNIFCEQSVDCFGCSKYTKHPKSPDMLPSAHQITWSWTMKHPQPIFGRWWRVGNRSLVAVKEMAEKMTQLDLFNCRIWHPEKEHSSIEQWIWKNLIQHLLVSWKLGLLINI